MIQTRTTGSTISCLWPASSDHARLPVMVPRTSDSDMCRDGSHTAVMRLEHAVDEHGGLRGVSDLDHFADRHMLASNRGRLLATEEAWRWRNLAESRTQIGRRDKSTAVGRGACGWVEWIFLSAPACALLALDTITLTKTIFAAPSAGIFTGLDPGDQSRR